MWDEPPRNPFTRVGFLGHFLAKPPGKPKEKSRLIDFSIGSYNSLVGAAQRDAPEWGRLVEAAGEPQYWLVACSALKRTVTSFTRRLPVHQGQKGL